MYRLLVASSAKRGLKKLKKKSKTLCLAVARAMDALRSTPRPSGCKKLVGAGPDDWRIRVGSYRVLYEIDDRRQEVKVSAVLHRGKAYD